MILQELSHCIPEGASTRAVNDTYFWKLREKCLIQKLVCAAGCIIHCATEQINFV